MTASLWMNKENERKTKGSGYSGPANAFRSQHPKEKAMSHVIRLLTVSVAVTSAGCGAGLFPPPLDVTNFIGTVREHTDPTPIPGGVYQGDIEAIQAVTVDGETEEQVFQIDVGMGFTTSGALALIGSRFALVLGTVIIVDETTGEPRLTLLEATATTNGVVVVEERVITIDHSSIAPFQAAVEVETNVTLNADGTLDYSFNSSFTSQELSLIYVIEGSGVLVRIGDQPT